MCFFSCTITILKCIHNYNSPMSDHKVQIRLKKKSLIKLFTSKKKYTSLFFFIQFRISLLNAVIEYVDWKKMKFIFQLLFDMVKKNKQKLTVSFEVVSRVFTIVFLIITREESVIKSVCLRFSMYSLYLFLYSLCLRFLFM